MSVKIGHASCDERQRASGGKSGDQTGREVCMRDWYSGSWNVLIRPKSQDVAEKMARFCEDVCNNPCIGYDQSQRNTLRNAAMLAGWDGRKILTKCETDCSAFMTVCAESAGISVPYAYGNAPTTWTMRNSFLSTGAFDILTDSKYLVKSDYLKRGDILVRESGHTAMVLSNGAKANVAEKVENKESAKENPTNENPTNKRIHTVVSGDTLWGISQKYGTTVNAICTENRISSNKFIFPGQKLVIP